jgi:hypothetical protein
MYEKILTYIKNIIYVLVTILIIVYDQIRCKLKFKYPLLKPILINIKQLFDLDYWSVTHLILFMIFDIF